MKVKQPAESKYPWDYLSIEAKIPADEAFRLLGATGCNLAGAPPTARRVRGVYPRTGELR